MNLSEYTRMEKFEKTFWWHKGRFYLLSLILNKHLPKKEHKQIFEIVRRENPMKTPGVPCAPLANKASPAAA